LTFALACLQSSAWSGSSEARLSAAAGAGSPAPQNLAGSTLRPVSDADALVESLIDAFTGGGNRPRPSIDRVVVSDDTERRLVVAVSCSGMEGLLLEGEVYGRDRRRPQTRARSAPLTTPTGEATLTFELPHGAAEEVVQSAYLRVTAVDPARSMRVASRVFELSKKWLSTPSPENVVVTVAPQPIGTAARLGDRPDYARPPRTLVPLKAVVTDVRPTTDGAVIRDHRDRRPNDGAIIRDHRRTAEAVRQPPAAAAAARQPAAAAAATPQVSATVRDHRKETATKTKPAAEMLPANIRVAQLERFKYGVKPEDVQKGAQGPAAAPIELLEGLSTEDIGLNPAALLRMSSSIYPDKNAASGVFYYYPRSYHLVWTPESGHAMRILYGAATGEDAPVGAGPRRGAARAGAAERLSPPQPGDGVHRVAAAAAGRERA
jgi:hypothetical protein